MRLIVVALPLLAGCNALGGIPESAISAIANAGGGCVAVESLVMGKAIAMVGSVDRGVIRNGRVQVSAGCGGILIEDTRTIKPLPPLPPQ